MFDKKFKKMVEDSIPQPVIDVTKTVETQVKSFLQRNLSKLDAVSQTEFKNLAKSITKLAKRVEVLEEKAGITKKATKTSQTKTKKAPASKQD
ncbi:MAG: hypothetical protein CMF46_04570 [Legionellales bacterium]|nr:hypothetical protein [Legionellales bacterium]|tara:strand:+ start:1224 stop:1502 length:279 start_codon:yes stop_codon:yes gene_type:complete